jgi:hypothetical protein
MNPLAASRRRDRNPGCCLGEKSNAPGSAVGYDRFQRVMLPAVPHP